MLPMAGDVTSPNFYAKPNFEHLFHSIVAILFGGDLGITIILTGGLLIAVLHYARRVIENDQFGSVIMAQPQPEMLSRLQIMMIALGRKEKVQHKDYSATVLPASRKVRAFVRLSLCLCD